MGRELRRKQAKKEGKSLVKEEVVEKNQGIKLITILLVLIFVMSLIYILSELFVTKNLHWFGLNGNDESTVSTSTILASTVFNRSEEEYYVYFYDPEEKDNKIKAVIDNKLSSSKVYKVDTTDSLNANYVGEEGNKSAKKLTDLKVVTNTLIKISNGVITEYYEGNEIVDKLS
jgi:hypothetical protein